MLTVDEIAAWLRFHPETIRRLLRKGEFPNAVLLSRRAGWRIPRSDVQSYLRRNSAGETQ